MLLQPAILKSGPVFQNTRTSQPGGSSRRRSLQLFPQLRLAGVPQRAEALTIAG
jgi:hypothetical protein